MSEITNIRNVRTNRLTATRRAGLFLICTAGALTFTGAVAGTASAFTPPAPQPDLPILMAPQQPQPPVGPMIIALPEGDGPSLDGPDQIAQPLPTPEPHPTPGPQGPDDLAQPEGDGPGLPGPDDFTNGEDEPGVPGPDDFTNGDGGTVDPDPQPEPEVAAEVELAEDVNSDAPASSLAFTGGELGGLTAGLVLLGAGGVAAAAGIASRRRAAAAVEA